jgi:hypothetical protein
MRINFAHSAHHSLSDILFDALLRVPGRLIPARWSRAFRPTREAFRPTIRPMDLNYHHTNERISVKKAIFQDFYESPRAGSNR